MRLLLIEVQQRRFMAILQLSAFDLAVFSVICSRSLITEWITMCIICEQYYVSWSISLLSLLLPLLLLLLSSNEFVLFVHLLYSTLLVQWFVVVPLIDWLFDYGS